MNIPISVIPDNIIKHYNLQKNECNLSVMVRIDKGMYGLKQAEWLAYKQLVNHLQTEGYHPAEHIPGLFKHNTSNLQFILVVYNFGVKFTTTEELQHLI